MSYLKHIRQDLQDMQAYTVQNATGMVKLDAMENPYPLPPDLQTALGQRLGALAVNRYPGARVDIQSLEYSFGFDDALQQDWCWTERYAAQPELLAYANHVADRYALRDGILLNTRITAARGCNWPPGSRRTSVCSSPRRPTRHRSRSRRRSHWHPLRLCTISHAQITAGCRPSRR